jgi:hypothetical protein
MSDPAPSRRPTAPARSERGKRLEELAGLPADSPELDRVLPAWVTEAHRRYLETGEGDPWGGYFS